MRIRLFTQIRERLDAISAANPKRDAGTGVAPGHYILLCRYRNRRIASKLKQHLLENGIRVKTQMTRLHVDFLVRVDDREKAFCILEEFRRSHADRAPRGLSRDYDIVCLLVFATMVCAGLTALFQRFSSLIPLAIIFTGTSLCVMVEYDHRNFRYQGGRRFSLRELLIGVGICAINLAAWRLAL